MTHYSISESEWQVLSCLWKQSPLEIKDILAMLQEKTGWNANMVRTLIVRLHEKGAVGAEKGGRCYRFSRRFFRFGSSRAKARPFHGASGDLLGRCHPHGADLSGALSPHRPDAP